MAERVQKILSQRGIASRRQAEDLIRAGRVRLNGAVVELGQLADPQRDAIEVDGRLIPRQRPQKLYLLLNKPAGVVSTRCDPEGRSTVIDLLPPDLREAGVYPVGRLDTASTGALLLTNDGDLTLGLTHPRHTIPKLYRVWVRGQPSRATLTQWRQGILLEGQKTLPAQVEVMQTKPDRTLLQIELREGRNRQIRKVADLLGHPVIRLRRIAIGAIDLGQLPEGQCRSLTFDEIAALKAQIAGSKTAGTRAQDNSSRLPQTANSSDFSQSDDRSSLKSSSLKSSSLKSSNPKDNRPGDRRQADSRQTDSRSRVQRDNKQNKRGNEQKSAKR